MHTLYRSFIFFVTLLIVIFTMSFTTMYAMAAATPNGNTNIPPRITTPGLRDDDKLLVPLPPKVKNYLEDGKTSPAYDLKGAGNVQLLDVGPKRIADIIFGFFSIISVIVALRAGISVLFSKGDAAKFKNGIMAIIYAAIGIVLIGSAWIIVRLVLDINLGT
ncbi:MAG: hypothetical protein ACK4NC_00045 [Candidatus Gracilibacteria bacterium]